jgi:NhaA family Na+:H+ antiporter
VATSRGSQPRTSYGSVIAARLAALVLRARNRHCRRICAAEKYDADGVPDVYERDMAQR